MDVMSKVLILVLLIIVVVGGALLWLSKYVFTEVSLNESPTGSDPAAPVNPAELNASALQFQLEVAEDLAPDAAMLNALSAEVREAQMEAERAASQSVPSEAPIAEAGGQAAIAGA